MSAPKISPALPVTFASYCQEQMKEWDLLFPAERSYFERLFALLDRTDPAQAFAPLLEIERQMGVNERNFPKGQFTLEQVDFLNRNPHYSEWRAAIAQVFSRLDPILDAEIARKGHPRLAIVIAPAELPVGPDRMWTRIQHLGKRIAIEPAEDWPARAAEVAQFYCSAKRDPYTAFVVLEGGLQAAQDFGPPFLSYEALLTYRKRLMREVQKVVDAKEIPGPRQLSARLKQMKILASEGDLARDPVLAEFARAILLSGNGTLLINNTFVEWATVQAIRRARPSVMVAGFGIRNKVKPFSSLLIYADQDAASPIPSQMDTLGSYVDLEIFYQYIWQEFEKYPEYRNNTAYVFIANGMEEMLAIGPPDFPLLNAAGAQKVDGVVGMMREWLAV